MTSCLRRLVALPVRAAIIVGIASCAGHQDVRTAVDNSVKSAAQRSDALRGHTPLSTAGDGRHAFVERTATPFLRATSVARPTSETFPPIMQRVTLNAPGSYNIQQAAQLITEATGIPVTLSPDVIQQPLGAGQNGPTLAGGGQQAQAQNVAAAQLQQFFPITLNYRDLPLGVMLDSICASAGGLRHEFKDGRIAIFRYVTRTYTLAVPAGQFSTTMTIGKTSSLTTGSTTTGTNTGASSTGTSNAAFSTSYSVDLKIMNELRDGIASVLSANGKAIVMGSTGTVAVTDGLRQVEEVGRIVDDLNKVLTRQIYVQITVLSFRTSEGAEVGVDWNLVLSKVNAAGNQTAFSFVSPAGSSSTTAGSIGVKLLRQVNGGADWSGTSALLKALNSIGKTQIERTWEGYAMNRRITPVAAIRSTSYIAATTPAVATTGGTGGVPGLTPGNISYGFVLNLIPTITNRNSLVLEFGMDLSDLNALVSQTSGTGQNQQSIELPDTIAQQLLQSTMIDTGDVLIVSGLDQSTHTYDKRTLTRDGEPGLGGLFKGSVERQSLIVLITPVIANAGF